MSDEAALLAAIYANPDEDTPRLVYPDWLDENGQPERAEFIRVQIELAGLEPWTEQAVELSIRELQLLHARRNEWVAELPLFAKLRFGQGRFRRGFPYSLGYGHTTLQYLKNAPQLARESALQEWGFGVTESDVLRLAKSKHLARIRSLSIGFGNGSSWDAVRTLLTSPHLTGLRELVLGSRYLFNDFEAGEFDKIPAVRDVEQLKVWGDAFALVANSSFTRLNSLAIRLPATPGFPDIAGQRFAMAPWLPELAELDVGTLTDLSIGNIERLPTLPKLKTFRCGVGNVQRRTKRLVAAPALQNVVELSMTGLEDHTVEALLKAPFLEQIQVLDCSHADSESFVRLVDSGRLTNLLKLRMESAGDAKEILKSLARSRGLPNLRHLADIPHVSSRTDLKAMRQQSKFPKLRLITNGFGEPIWLENKKRKPTKKRPKKRQ